MRLPGSAAGLSQRRRRPWLLTGRRSLASELTARAGSAGGGLLPCLTCLAFDAPGQLGCLVPCSGLRLCPGRELFRRRAELLAAPLDLLFQLLRVTGSCRLGIGLRVRFRSDQLVRVLLVCRWLATLPARRQAVPRDGHLFFCGHRRALPFSSASVSFPLFGRPVHALRAGQISMLTVAASTWPGGAAESGRGGPGSPIAARSGPC